MKKLVIILIVLLSGLILFSPIVSAVNILPSCTSGKLNSTDVCGEVNSNKDGPDPVITILKTVIELISYIIGVAAVIVLIIAGIQMMTQGDDPQSVSTARNMMIYALVGIVVAVLAESIVVFVLKRIV